MSTATKMRLAACSAALAVGMSAAALPANAAVLLTFDANASSTNTPASGATGTALFTFSDLLTDGSGVTTFDIGIDITNTSAAPVTAATLVGLAFNFISGATYKAGSYANNTIGGKLIQAVEGDSIGLPGGSNGFALCASGDASCQSSGGGGGTPAGIAIGGTENVSLTAVYTGSLASIAAIDSAFFDLFDDDPNAEKPFYDSAMRFQSISGGAATSDKLFNPVVTPLPAPVLLLLGGLGGLGLMARRRKAASA